MNKAYFLLSVMAFTILFISSCKKDEGVSTTPPRDRGQEAIDATVEIEEFLASHFYNYEEFENPPLGFDFVIKFDSLIGDNATKTPLIDQVDSKMVTDRVESDVTYKLYYLNVRQGGGEPILFPDIGTIAFEGRLLDNTQFDGSVTPVRFDLTGIINGLQDGLTEFNTAVGDPIIHPDGTTDFLDYGIGAVFIPSGLAYFANPPSIEIGIYDQLIFTFKLYQAEMGDQDDDNIPSFLEDLNSNTLEEDDDTDADGDPNFADPDDDNDGRLSKNEIIINTYVIDAGDPEPVLETNEVEIERETDASTGEITITTILFPDEDGDGTPDYLDTDN